MSDQKIAREVAEAEFNRFAWEMDLDLDPEGMDEEDRKGLETQKRRITQAIESGSLVINEKGEPVYTPKRTEGAEAITFREPKGGDLMAMDRKKKNEDMGKLFATMAAITGQHANVFSSMKQADLRVCIAIITLFLG